MSHNIKFTWVFVRQNVHLPLLKLLMRKYLTKFFCLFIFLTSFSFSLFAQIENPLDSSSTSLRDSSATVVEGIKENLRDNIPVITLDENEIGEGSSQNISSQLNAGRDPFLNAATFKFSAARFRIRGYDNDLFETYINGAPMENLDNGFTPYGLWSGLNDVLRNRETNLGLRPTSFGYGDLGGATFIDTRASRQRKQTSISYARSNRNYNNRVMLTHSTGFNKKGWAFSLSGSARWAEEGYIEGTYYQGYSVFLGVDKRISDKHMLSFVAFATPTENGRQGPAVQEIMDIAGTNYYNPYWGYQNGKKRNSNVGKTFQPIFILSHDWKINDKTSLLTAGSYTFGKRSTTALDWYNAPDPRPDYYRYLPSYQTNPSLAGRVLDALQNNVNLRQINWDKLYNINYISNEVVHNVDGIQGNDVSGKRSRYILEERVNYTNRFNINSTLNTALASNIELTAALTYEYQQNNYYEKVNDLLGGDFYVDLNQFAERDFPGNPNALQNDLNHPNRILHVGDKFGDDYDIDIQKASGWVQSVFKYRKVDFFIATQQSYTSFWRVGNVRNGLFPDNSFGKSSVQSFYNYGFKGGVTYKLNGRNYLFANGSYSTKAPYFENSYIAPRTRDFVQDGLRSENIVSAEGGYILNAPSLKVRLTGFYTQFKNQFNVISFYNDQFENFVNYALSNIGKEQYGVEFGTEAKLYKGLSINAAASVGRYYYNTRQNATVTLDNSAQILSKDIVYSTNFRVPTPQEVYSVGLDYRSRRFWYVDLSVSYFDQMFLDFNPLRRTAAAVDGLDPKSDQWRGIIDQTKLKAQTTVDFFGGYSWKVNNKFKSLKKPTYLVFNVGVNNLLNNKTIISGGYEQLRFDFENKNINKFPPKFYYAYGLNFFANVTLRF